MRTTDGYGTDGPASTMLMTAGLKPENGSTVVRAVAELFAAVKSGKSETTVA